MTRTGRATAGLFALASIVAASLTSCTDPLLDVVITSPSMWPVFHTAAKDYVNRCDPDTPTKLDVKAPPGAVVSINGRPGQRGTFTTTVRQRPNERMSIVITLKGTTTSHSVRCLPAGFPQWDSHRRGEGPQSEFYVTTLLSSFGPTNWPVIFDANGVPVWWSGPLASILTTPLSNGNLARMLVPGGMVEHRLDGSTVRVLNTDGAPSDHHDVVLLPDGNFAMVTIDERPCDLGAWGRPDAQCFFHEVQVLTPEGDVVWRWRVEDDIPITETPPRWRDQADPMGIVDPWHWNAIEWTGDGFLLSLRHTDAVYKVDYATGDIVWKLGGTPRPESLRVIGDRYFDIGSSISGQHDVRLQPDGTITLFDNRTASGVSARPRVVRYRIDEAAGTATLVHELRDPIAPTSQCCGSARVLPSGNYVVGWGGTPWFTENRPDGTQVFRLKGSIITYRVIPVAPGEMDLEAIRRGMDAQYDGLTPSHVARSGPQLPPPDPVALGDPETSLGMDLPGG